MKNEFSANEAMMDYNQKEWEQRKQWAKVLAAPVKPRQIKPVAKQGLFSKLFKAV